ncbi:alkaline phosphatase family protein [Blastopirellula marina]|uniref:Probable nucleotide pyrophosphatase-like protein n=1 Tax=Blastopirellula marina DSM 3645 TaxID=314230 RepID=A3ZUR8_9BACT|nr:alkaline phosphatase family protein [Blastopirellula marina]EAQ79654.1 probable nucleotide pyrophosphatase-like protein [Blastopirellula marina DSM 3645]
MQDRPCTQVAFSEITMMFARMLTLLLLAVAAPLSAAEKEKHVLLLGIDGCRFDALQKAKTPNLDRLMAEGIYSPTALILGDRYRKNDTISGPGWGSINTGVWADKHNVQGNQFKEPRFDKFPHFFHYVKLADPKARTASIINWSPIARYIVSSADVSVDTTNSEKAYDKADADAAAEAIRLLAAESPTALMLYLGEVDEAGHAHGFHPSVPPYIAAIENVDSLIGSVLDAIEKRTDEEWLIVVTSDHGGAGTGHSNGHTNPDILHSFLIVSGAGAQRGKFDEQVYIVDAVPTLLTYLGIKIDDAWQLDGHAVGLKLQQADQATSAK